MSRSTIKYSCFLTLFILIFYAIFPIIPFTINFSTAVASDIDGKDIYKGLGVALLFILISRLGQSRNASSSEIDEFFDYPDLRYSNEDLDILASAIHGEARGEPYNGQVAVGAVILNRVKSSDFPNTIKEVVYQKNQFSAVDDGQINLVPNETSYRAAVDALKGRDPSLGALFFYNPKTARTIEWLSQRKTTVIIGDHVFAK